MNHTPPPWKDASLLFSAGWRCIVTLPNGRSIDIADPRNRKTDAEDKANAALVASAPALKEERDALLLQVEEMKSDLKESNADADALILLSKGLYERIQGKPEWVVPSACQTALNYIDHVNRRNATLNNAVEALLSVCDNILKIEDGGKNYIAALAECKREIVLPALRDNCKHKWAHIEDHHVICEKCKHTADLCWTCESEKAKTADGRLVCLKCNLQ